MTPIYKAFTQPKQQQEEQEEEHKEQKKQKKLMDEEGPSPSMLQESKLKKAEPKPMVKYNIPEIFDGGIYGSLCRSKQSRALKRNILYLVALCMLGLNALFVYLGNSSLGIIGLITNFIYDMFIFAFAGLKIEERSVRNIFLLIFLGRIMSFIFGQQLWIFGYCLLYLIVGVFVGKIIIEQRLPLRKPRTVKH